MKLLFSERSLRSTVIIKVFSGGGFNLKNIRNFCVSATNSVFSIAAAAVAVMIIFNVSGNFVNAAYFNMAAVCIFSLVIFAVTAFVYIICVGTSVKRLLLKHPIWIMAVTLSVLFAVQALIAKQVYTRSGWDPAIVNVCFEEMDDWAALIYDLYLTRYPNNVLLTAIFKVFYGLVNFAIPDPWYSSILLNIFAVDIGIALISLTAKRIFGIKTYYFTFWLSLLLLSFNPTLVVPYSDTMAIPFTAGFLFCIAVLKTTKKRSVRYGFSFLAGALLFTGYFIKPTVLIAGIAAVIWLVLSIKKPEPKKVVSLLLSAVLIVSGMGVGVLFKKLAEPIAFHDIPNKEMRYMVEFPMTHFIMMGLNDTRDGYYGYFEDDYHLTFYVNGKNEKIEMNKKVIKERIEKFGVSGLAAHLAKKAVWVTTDGTFFYGGEGLFHAQMPKKIDGIGGFLQNFTYVETDVYQKYFANYMQAVWLLAAIAMALNFFKRRKDCSEEQNTLRFIAELSIIGLILFLMLFEARSRYLFLYLPYFILLSSLGWQTLESKINKIVNE